MINKILIANRGEIALRIIRSCKEMGINTVAVYSTIDKESLHVKFADEAVCIGPPNSKDSYLNIPKIIAAAEITNSEAIHPGYGFLAENSEFSKICSESKIKFIGPTHHMIERMGDKITAKKTMEKAGIPTVPGSKDLVKSIAEGKKLGKRIGYPIILKATAGGGGKGMRIVNAEKDFKKSWEEATNESSAVFGNSGLYIEKYIEELGAVPETLLSIGMIGPIILAIAGLIPQLMSGDLGAFMQLPPTSTINTVVNSGLVLTLVGMLLIGLKAHTKDPGL